MIDITDKSKCCGCSACANACPKQCITMKADCEGFLYPEIEQSKCIGCNICDKACPIINVKEEQIVTQSGYVVQNRDRAILRDSTSGGAFTAIAKYVIHHNGIVFGAVLNDDMQVEHAYTEKESELSQFRNSKYIQSNIKNSYNVAEAFLQQGRIVLFSGTPCQIEGLKCYLQKNYQNLITVDVVCRAVPSPYIFNKYIDMQQKRLGTKVRKVRFRDKFYGYKYSTLQLISNNKNLNYHHGIDSDPWLRAFFSDIINRPSCYECMFRKQYRASDVTIWDCLNVYEFDKKLDNDMGATRVLIHTEKGRDIFDKIKEDFFFTEVSPEILIGDVAEIKKSVTPHTQRQQFFNDAQFMEGDQLFKKYFPNTAKVKIEHAIRMICYKIGVYKFMKKLFIKITRRY